MSPKPVRRRPPIPYIEELARGETLFRNGKGKFLFPCDSSKQGVRVQFKRVENPNCYPNCALPNFKDEIKVSKTPSGYEIFYEIDSPQRIMEWILVSYTS